MSGNILEFQHVHSAHCESGVVSALLQHYGIHWNEAMVFGSAAALSFAYIPLVKLAGLPLISYRMPPKTIIKNTCKNLGLRLDIQKFRNPEQGMAALDAALDAGRPVGMQTSVFWLPYMPEALRFHFNAHNLIVYGREGDDYLISDPVFETVQRCDKDSLKRARFAKGALAAKGLMYSINPADAAAARQAAARNFAAITAKAVKKTARNMLAPLFFIGYRGMHTVADNVAALAEAKQTEAQKKLYLGHLVRMQEEIGTGGAGFRYIYAYYLEQAGTTLQHPQLLEAAKTLTAIGDEWRVFASLCVRQCRKPKDGGYQAAADALHAIAEKEKALWQLLKKTTI